MIFVGFNVTFFTQFMMGSQGMPRRYYDYVDEYATYHVISTLGSYIMAAGFVLTAICLVRSLISGRQAPVNPWGGRSLEWQTASPPIHHNFEETPAAVDPYDFEALEWDEKQQGFVIKENAATL